MKKEMKLEDVLEVLWQEMDKKGLLSEEMKQNKDEIFSEMSRLIKDNDVDLRHDDFSNINVQRSLMTLMISVTLGLKIDPNKVKLTLDDAKLKDEPDPKIDQDLKLTLFKLIAVRMGLDKVSPKLQPGEQLQKNKEETKEDTKDEKKELELSQEEADALEKEMSDFYRSLYGGDDPRFTSEVQSVVTYIKGNIIGFAHQSASDPNSPAFMVEESTYNAGEEDYLGIENKTAIANLMTGAVEGLSDAVSESVATVKSRPSLSPE